MEWRLFADLAEVAGERRVPAEGATVQEALDALLEERPALRERVLDGDELEETITVLHDGETVRDRSVAVEPGDELALMPPVSGG